MKKILIRFILDNMNWLVPSALTLIVIIMTAIISRNQGKISKKQIVIQERQTALQEKQSDIMQQQNNIALFEKRLEAYKSIVFISSVFYNAFVTTGISDKPYTQDNDERELFWKTIFCTIETEFKDANTIEQQINILKQQFYIIFNGELLFSENTNKKINEYYEFFSEIRHFINSYYIFKNSYFNIFAYKGIDDNGSIEYNSEEIAEKLLDEKLILEIRMKYLKLAK